MTRSNKQRGFTLIEIMVGLMIGLIATVIIFQAFAVSERQKRTTTGTSDAQGNGAIAMFMLEKSIKTAGAGLNHTDFGSCTTLYTYDANTGGPIDAVGGASLFTVASIVDNGSDPDSITLLYYDDPMNPNYRFSESVLDEATVPNPSADLRPRSARNCTVGGMALMAQSGNCMLMTVTGVTASTPASSATIVHAPAPAGRYNPPVATSSTWPKFLNNQTFFQCFPGLFRLGYSIGVDGATGLRQLQVTEPDPATGGTKTTPVVPDIVNFQAQFGIEDTTLVPPIRWEDATGAWAAPALADVFSIKAVRIAVLARNGEYQKPDDSGVCNATTADTIASWGTWANFNLAALGPDFACYRYKVFESVMPLRNILWAKP